MDLSNLQNEIKALTQLKTAQENTLRVEKNLNNILLQGTNIRRKYTDALTAAAEAQKDILDKEVDLSSALKNSHKELNESTDKYKKLKNAGEELLKNMKILKKDKKEETDSYKKSIKSLNSTRDSLNSTRNSMKDYVQDLNKTSVSIKKLDGNAKEVKSTFDKLSLIDNTDIGSMGELNKLTEQRINVMKQQYDLMVKSGTITEQESNAFKDQLETLESMHDIQGDLVKRKVSKGAYGVVDETFGEAKKTGTKVRDVQYGKARELRGNQLENLKSIFSGKTSMTQKIGSVKSLKGASGDLGKLNEVMGVTGKTAAGVGGMMRTLGTAFKALGTIGWIGMIISAVTTIVNLVNRLDKFLKGFNQTFAKLQGPTVMMGNVDKAMDKFTDSIFNLQRNLKYGLKSEDITGMFQGISEAGMSLQGVIKNVAGGYDKLIEDSAKVHLNFGVSMQEAGAMLGEQMTDLRSSLEEASEGFKVLSYDASIAGIQSQKFYQATYAAAEALSYYGKFLTTASNTLKKFQDQGGMGFKDSQKQTQEMTNLFKDMDKNSRVAFMEMSGGVESYRKDFIKLEAQSSTTIKKHLDSLAAKRTELSNAEKTNNKDAIDRIKNEISAEEAQLTATQKTYAMAGAAAKSNAQDMAMYLELVSDKVGDKLGNYFKQLREEGGPNIFGDARAMVEHMKAILPVSDEFAMKMIGTVQTLKAGIGTMASELDKVLPEGKRSQFGNKIQDIITDAMKTGQMDMKMIKDGLEAYAGDMDVGRIYDYLDKFPKAVQAFLKEGLSGVTKNVESITIDELGNVEKITGEGAEAQADRLDDLVKNTRTIEDFIGINKENAEYYLAGNDIQKGVALAAIQTARSTSRILDWVAKIGKKQGVEGRTEEEFRKSEDYKTLGKLMEKEIILRKELKSTPLEDKEKRAKLAARIEGVQGMKRGVAGGNLYQEGELQAQSVERVKAIYETKKKLLDRIATVEKKAAETTGDTQALFLEEANILKQQRDAYTNKKSYAVDITTEPVKQNKDYRATSGGYALLSKGDVVVNAQGMSGGVGGDLGAFSSKALSQMKTTTSGSTPNSAPVIPVQITIGSITGDADEILRKIKPAIEQSFERMYFDKQKRK
jgi:hypothetical protein